MPRVQLSLYVPAPYAEPIERVRRCVDPVQHELIPAHVTLCRDDELGAVRLSELGAMLSHENPVRLGFGEVRIFEGHGIALHCTEGIDAYAHLRRRLLGIDVRTAEPHITLAHPRNPRAAANKPEAIDLALPVYVTFDRVMLIEQEAGDIPWRILREFPLSNDSPPNQSLQPTAFAVTPAAGAPAAPAKAVADH